MPTPYQDILKQLHDGATVLTPNNRLSETIHEHYFRYFGSETVIKPQCLSWGHWLSSRYEQLIVTQNLPICLSSEQAYYLWQQIIQKHSQWPEAQGLALASYNALKICHEWCISPDDACFEFNPQTSQFQKWWQAFNEEQNNLNVITALEIPTQLIVNDDLSYDLIWACFDDITPQQQRLIQSVKDKGGSSTIYDLPPNNPVVKTHIATSEHDELEAIIHWIKTNQKKGATSAVVIPDLHQNAPAIVRLFEEHFNEEDFNISLGKPLTDYPMISHALLWLSLKSTQLDKHTWQLLLQSPFMKGGFHEAETRFQYLQMQQAQAQNMESLAQFGNEVKGFCPVLSEVIDGITPYPETATFVEWTSLFQQRLNQMGFPGDNHLHSATWQCYQQIETLFENFKSLQIFQRKVSEREAIAATKAFNPLSTLN